MDFFVGSVARGTDLEMLPFMANRLFKHFHLERCEVAGPDECSFRSQLTEYDHPLRHAIEPSIVIPKGFVDDDERPPWRKPQLISNVIHRFFEKTLVIGEVLCERDWAAQQQNRRKQEFLHIPILPETRPICQVN